jgi:hypothetical protein
LLSECADRLFPSHLCAQERVSSQDVRAEISEKFATRGRTSDLRASFSRDQRAFDESGGVACAARPPFAM